MRDFFTKQQMKSLIKRGFKVKKPSRYYVTMVKDLTGKKIPKDCQVDYTSFREIKDVRYDSTPFMTFGEVLDRIPKEVIFDYKIYNLNYNLSTSKFEIEYKSADNVCLFGYSNEEDPMKALFHFLYECLDIKYKRWFKI